MNRQWLYASVAIGLGTLVAACGKNDKGLVSTVNAQWPAPQHAQELTDAIALQETAFQSLEGPDLFLNVDVATLEQAVIAHVSGADSSLRKVEAHAEPQALVVDVDFESTFADIDTTVEGKAQLHAYPSLEGASLRFTPGAPALELTKAEGSATPEVLVTRLAGYLQEIGTQIAALDVALDYTGITQWKPTEWLASIPGARDVTGQQVALSASVSRASVLVDEAGVHALADFKVERLPLPVKTREVPPSDPNERFEALRAAFKARILESFGALDEAAWSATSASFTSLFVAAQRWTSRAPNSASTSRSAWARP
jgi:hypothetical protein